ncbi:hypothetical protein [Streptomyces sp. NPDC088270]|uniref:hypothetical protein n=1 Tax=Streptomyces sp. NPDC088270 TaxID=3160990 RepID=UPI0034449F50
MPLYSTAEIYSSATTGRDEMPIPEGLLSMWANAGQEAVQLTARQAWLLADPREDSYRCLSVIGITAEGVLARPAFGWLLPQRPLARTPHPLVSRAYTAVQQASVMLAQRVDIHQAVLQLATANAALAQWERTSGPSDDALVAACSGAARAVRPEADPRALAEIQGWFGRHGDSLLDRTVRRVFQATGPLPDTGPRAYDDSYLATRVGVNREVLFRAGGALAVQVYQAATLAHQHGEPAWTVLQRRCDQWTLSAASAHVLRLLASTARTAASRVHRTLLQEPPPLPTARIIYGLLVWSTLDTAEIQRAKLLSDGESEVGDAVLLELMAQIKAYAHEFLDGVPALHVLGSPPSRPVPHPATGGRR